MSNTVSKKQKVARLQELCSKQCRQESIKTGKIIYLDYASTTPIDEEVALEMEKVQKNFWGNSSAIHSFGVETKKGLEECRKSVADFFSCKPSEIIFTASGTESNNIAILGVVNAYLAKGRKYSDMHIITSNIEHPSILEPIKYLGKLGVKFTIVKVNEEGILNPNDIVKAVNKNTILISIQIANNEIGTIQPISKIAKAIQSLNASYDMSRVSSVKDNQIVFHCDASQAPLYISLKKDTLGVDLITIDGHKIYGPKGVGVLFIKRNTEILPIMFGGKQEGKFRPATENVVAIAGLTKALKLASERKDSESNRIMELRNIFAEKLLKDIPGIIINGTMENRLPNNVNISIPGVNSEYIVLYLDKHGIYCSTKSSCIKDGGSYIIGALGGDKWRANNSIRFTLGKDTKVGDLNYVIKILKKAILIGKE